MFAHFASLATILVAHRCCLSYFSAKISENRAMRVKSFSRQNIQLLFTEDEQ